MEGQWTFVELQQLEGASGAPALLLREPVVGVALVLGGFSHCAWLRCEFELLWKF